MYALVAIVAAVLLCVFSMYKAGSFVYQNKWFTIIKITLFENSADSTAKRVTTHCRASVLFRETFN